jgi:hypothetical protein
MFKLLADNFIWVIIVGVGAVLVFAVQSIEKSHTLDRAWCLDSGFESTVFVRESAFCVDKTGRLVVMRRR